MNKALIVGLSAVAGWLVVPAQATSPGTAYTIVSLGTLGGDNSEAYDINESGVIGGSSVGPAGGARAFIYQNGVMTDLGFYGDIWGINSTGQAVGRKRIPPLFSDQAFWFDGQQVIDLGTLGGDWSEAWAINSAGDIAGDSAVTGGLRGFLFHGGVMNDLGTLGGDYSAAYDINDSGVVVESLLSPETEKAERSSGRTGR